MSEWMELRARKIGILVLVLQSIITKGRRSDCLLLLQMEREGIRWP